MPEGLLAVAKQRPRDLFGGHAVDGDSLMPAGSSGHEPNRPASHPETLGEKPNEFLISRAIDGWRLHADLDRIPVATGDHGSGRPRLDV